MGQYPAAPCSPGPFVVLLNMVPPAGLVLTATCTQRCYWTAGAESGSQIGDLARQQHGCSQKHGGSEGVQAKFPPFFSGTAQPQPRDQKTMTARDVTGSSFFSDRKSGNVVHVLGRFPHLITQKTWKKKGKDALEKIGKMQWDGAPKLQISVPCRGRTCLDNHNHEKRFASDVASKRDLMRHQMNNLCEFLCSTV